jgi:hypothetical protein
MPLTFFGNDCYVSSILFRQLTMDINQEVKSQNKLLDGMVRFRNSSVEELFSERFHQPRLFKDDSVCLTQLHAREQHSGLPEIYSRIQ